MFSHKRPVVALDCQLGLIDRLATYSSRKMFEHSLNNFDETTGDLVREKVNKLLFAISNSGANLADYIRCEMPALLQGKAPGETIDFIEVALSLSKSFIHEKSPSCSPKFLQKIENYINSICDNARERPHFLRFLAEEAQSKENLDFNLFDSLYRFRDQCSDLRSIKVNYYLLKEFFNIFKELSIQDKNQKYLHCPESYLEKLADVPELTFQSTLDLINRLSQRKFSAFRLTSVISKFTKAMSGKELPDGTFSELENFCAALAGLGFDSIGGPLNLQFDRMIENIPRSAIENDLLPNYLNRLIEHQKLYSVYALTADNVRRNWAEYLLRQSLKKSSGFQEFSAHMNAVEFYLIHRKPIPASLNKSKQPDLNMVKAAYAFYDDPHQYNRVLLDFIGSEKVEGRNPELQLKLEADLALRRSNSAEQYGENLKRKISLPT